MLSQSQIQTFKNELLKQKEHIEERLNDPAFTPYSLRDSVDELSLADNHPGDLGTELYEREKDISLHEHLRNELTDVNIALQKIENGTYGICEISGEEIPLERLEALPTAKAMIEHTHDQHISSSNREYDRPIEEEILNPPFSRDPKDRSMMYDPEDSLQDVERYGSSQTPSDFEFNNIEEYEDTYTESYENVGYVEEFENFIGTDIHGKNRTVYPTKKHEQYEQDLDDYEEQALNGELSEIDVKDIEKY
ncbi:TraR/DksA C4-type zinc finger protein [Gottfriedia luciferensis]|uniref:TraR/DksA C4-type zinc finger protein n=1 Tax=Gottfriedia luciferensis TaxID=178774 RepID=UPI000B42D42A|nr:TraR/DksA C4-type zinc finger protein [Gottfriedia luciferensis]